MEDLTTQIKQNVTLVLNKKFNFPIYKAERMIEESAFNEILNKDIDHVQSRSSTYWATYILEEIQE